MSFPKQRSTVSETDGTSSGGAAAAAAVDDDEAALTRGGGGGSNSNVMGVLEMESSYHEDDSSSYDEGKDDEEQVSLVPGERAARRRNDGGGGGSGSSSSFLHNKTHKRLRKRCLLFVRRNRLYLGILTAAVIVGFIALAGFDKKNKDENLHLKVQKSDATTSEAGITATTKTDKASEPSKSCTPFLLEKLVQFLNIIDTQPQKDRCSTLFIPRLAQQQEQNNDPPPCLCMNPVRASMPNQYRWNASWQVAFQNNLQLVQQERASRPQKKKKQLDVVLLGDSITEAWHGTSMGLPEDLFQGNALVYKQLFDSDNAPVQGLALGISGDRCPQLLYRLQNGEIDGLYPKVFWILIGTNDFLQTACHAGEIVAGNIRIVHELLTQRPDATVVIQSILPVGDSNSIRYWEAYSAMNERLSCYASTVTTTFANSDRTDIKPKVQFVNVTQLFLTPQNTVNTSLLPDGLHPNGLAATLWGQVIVQKVREIIDAESNNNNKA